MNSLKKMSGHRNWYRYGVYLIFAIFYFWMAAQIPYTHDDWDWGSAVGIQQLLKATVNSRYVGNFFVVIMTRSEFVKILIMGGVSSVLPFLLERTALGEKQVITAGGRMILFLSANFLLLSVEYGIWRETYGWVSGYANYVISAVPMLMCFSLCQYAFEEKVVPVQQRSFGVCAGTFLLGVVAQLFLENLALYIVVLSATTVIVEYIRTKKVSRRTVCLLMGALVGLMIMFSSGIYSSLFENGTAVDGIRKLTISYGGSWKQTVALTLYVGAILIIKLFEYNFAISITVLAVLGVLLLRHRKSIHCLLAAINGVIGVYFSYNRIIDARPNVWFEAAVNVLFFLTVAAEVILLFAKEKKRLSKLLTAWVSGPVLILPLIVTTEQGPRLFLSSNMFMIVFVLILLDTLLSEFGEKGVRAVMLCGMVAVAAAILFYVGIYSDIGAVKEQRNMIIKEAIQTGVDTVYLPPYKHRPYLKGPDPANEFREYYFREFYGLAPDTEIVIEE